MKRNLHVLYLQFGPKLDEKYLQLSLVFSQFGMKLVPISVDEFKKLKLGSHEYILACVKDIKSLKSYRTLLRRYLNYSLRTSKVTLFEYSSFETIHEPRFLKEGLVQQTRLPVTTFQVAEKIGRKIYLDKTSGSKKWPGGTRVKLPTA